jgi:hypothetical protein
MIQPELQPILQSIFARLKALEDAKAKTLTDEEIDNLIMDVAEKPTHEDLYDFTIAILRKAQEK